MRCSFLTIYVKILLDDCSRYPSNVCHSFDKHTTEAPEIPPSEKFLYAFGSPFLWKLDNLSHLPANYTGKAYLWLIFSCLKCVIVIYI